MGNVLPTQTKLDSLECTYYLNKKFGKQKIPLLPTVKFHYSPPQLFY